MMLARYVSKTTGLAMLGAMGLLLFLQAFFAYIGQLSELKNDYNAWQALTYIFWLLPEFLYALLPIACLMGSVIGLGLLASSSELIIMRAAGVSLWRIVRWVLRPALLFMVLSLLLSQFILPYSAERAQRVRQHGQTAKLGEVHGFWLKNNQQFIYLRYANSQGHIDDIQMMQFDNQARLTNTMTAQAGDFLPQSLSKAPMWRLKQVYLTRVLPDGSLSRTLQPTYDIPLNLEPRFVHLLTSEPSALAPTQLWQYMHYMQQQGSVPASYKLAWWQKLMAPFALAVLVIVACSFVFGPLRQQSIGFRIVIALFVGLGFRYLQDFLGYMSLIYTVSPAWFVVVPLILLGGAGAWALKRMQ